MATSLATARSLLNGSEFELVAASFPRSGVTYTKAVLKQKILRTRKLRDQARDLKRRQKIGYRAKTGIEARRQAGIDVASPKRASRSSAKRSIATPRSSRS